MAEGDAQNLFQFLKSDVSTDEKTTQLENLRSFFNKNNIPNDDLPVYIECFKVSLATVNPLILRSAISCYETFLRRLRAQCPSWVKFRVPLLKNLVVDHLASRDLRKRILTILLELWQFNPIEIERSLHHILSNNKNAEIRMQALKWFALAHRSDLSFDLKALRPFLFANLEHADPSLREETKELLVLLHKDLSSSTKAHLLRELESHQGLRKDLLQFLSKKLSPQSSDDSTSLYQSGSLSLPSTLPIISSFYPAVELEKLDPLYVNFPKQLEQDVAAMLSSFEGRETEQNWSLRQSNILQIRRYMRGNAPDQYLPELLSVLKSLLRGILVSFMSLRTTLSYSTIQLLKEMAFILKNNMDGYLDALLPNLLKMCSVTKRIVSQAANVTFASILSLCGPLSRNLQFVSLAANDSNAQLRVFASGWISLLLALYPVAKSHIKISANQNLFEKIICKGITDSNSQVRESYRKSFWKFVEYFPNSKEDLLKTFEPSSIKQLELANPNRNQQHSSSALSGPKRAPMRSMTPAIRPEVKGQKDETPFTPPVPQRKLGLPQRMVAPSRERVDAQSKTSSTLSTPSSSNTGLGHPSSTATPQSSKKPISSNTRESSEASSFEKLKSIQKDYESKKANDSLLPQSFTSYVPFLTQTLYHGTPLLYSILYTPALIELLCICIDTQSFLSQFLLSVYDLSNAGNAFALTSFPYLKSRHPPHKYFFILFDLLMEISSMSPSHKSFSFNTNQKRIVIHGCLLWMKEILEGEVLYIKQRNTDSSPPSKFSIEQLKLCSSRIIPMITKTRLTSKNWLPLSGLLYAFNSFDPEGFDKLLGGMDKESKTKLLHSWAYQDEFKKNNENNSPSLPNQPMEDSVSKNNDINGDIPKSTTISPSKETVKDASIIPIENALEKPQDIDMLTNSPLKERFNADNQSTSFTSDLAYDVARDSLSSSQSLKDGQVEKENEDKPISSFMDQIKESDNRIQEDKSMDEHTERIDDENQNEQHTSPDLSKATDNIWVFDAPKMTPRKDELLKQENKSSHSTETEKTAPSINVLTDKSNTMNSINVNVAGKGKMEEKPTSVTMTGNPYTKENYTEQLMKDSEMHMVSQARHIPSEEELSIISTKLSYYPDEKQRSDGFVEEKINKEDASESANQTFDNRNIREDDISLSFSELKVPNSDPTVSSPMSDVSQSLTEETVVGYPPQPLSPSVISNSRKESLAELPNVGKLEVDEFAASATISITNVVPQNKWLQNRMKKLEKGSSKIKNMDSKKISQYCTTAVEALKNGNISSKLIKICLSICKETPHVLLEHADLFSSLLEFIKVENQSMHVSDSLLLLHEYIVQSYQVIEDNRYECAFFTVLEKGDQRRDDPIIMAAVEDVVTVIANVWRAEKSVIFIHDMLLQRQISEKKMALCLLFFSEFLKRFNDFTHPLMERLIKEVVIKYIEHPDAEIRRATFNTCLVVNSIVRSEEKTMSILGDLTEGQKNLLSHVWKMNG